MDEQLLHILVPAHSSHALGKGLSHKVTQTHPASYQRQRRFANPNPPIPSGRFCLQSNTTCLCLLNLGIGFQPRGCTELSCSNCLSPRQTQSFVPHLREKKWGKIILPSSWKGPRTGKWAAARREAMCRSLTVSLYCSGYKQNGNVC